MAPRLNILVRAPNWIGDQVLAYPFYYFLRKAYPEAHIVSACVEWVKDIQFMGFVNEVFVMPRSKSGSLVDRFSAVDQGAVELRKKTKWDFAFSMPNSVSAAWFMFRSGARRRRGYAVEGRGLLLTDRLRWDPSPSRHRAQAYVDLLPQDVQPKISAKEFWGIPAENELDQKVLGVEEVFDVARHWPSTELLKAPSGKYWVLAPGAQAESRQWPLNYYIQLIEMVQKATQWKTVIVGGPKEEALMSELTQQFGDQIENYVNRGSVSSLAQVFRGAEVSVCNESGLAHVAALCGSPVQIICGAADPRRTRPMGPGRVQVKVNPVDCWPCERNVCLQPSHSHLKCLRGISPEVVWEEMKLGFNFK